MVSLDKEKKKRQKEAKTVYEKSLKAFNNGEISKDQLKERLRPYKYELKELGYPVKIKDEEQPPQLDTSKATGSLADAMAGKEQADPGRTGMLPSDVVPWKKRSHLTLDEIEKRIDQISLSKKPSERLQTMYHNRYGEDLEPPLDLVPYRVSSGTDQPDVAPSPAPQQTSDAGNGDDSTGKRPFWKGLFKGKRKE